MCKNIKNVLGRIFFGKEYENDHFEKYSRIIFLNLIIALGILFIVPYGYVSLLNDHYVLAGLDFAGALILCVLLLYIRCQKVYTVPATIFVLLATFHFLYLILSGGVGGTGYLWSFILPALAIFLLGIKTGSIIVATFMCFLIAAFLPESPFLRIEYSFNFKIRFLGAFSFMSILVFLTEFVKSKALEIVRKGNRELEKALWKLQCTEDELRVSEVKYRTFVENFPGISFQGTVQFKPYFLQGAVSDITGYTQEEFLCGTVTWQNIIHSEDRDLLHIDLFQDNLIENDESCYRIITKDGKQKWIRQIITKLSDNGNEYIQGSFSDITEQKKTERQLFQTRKLESIGTLAGGVAHDFNNLLTVIIGKSDLLLLGLKENEKLYDDIYEIKNTANRAADLTRQLLAFSRKQLIRPRRVNFNSVILEMNKLLGRLIHENIELVYNLKEDAWDIFVDPAQIDQIITNLVVNARDAMPDGGKIEISTDNIVMDNEFTARHIGSQKGEYVLLKVKDNGLGMDEHTVSHAFEPFFTTKELGRGTGLGLATCYGIAKQNGGYIFIESALGKGTTVSFYLPRSNKLSVEDSSTEENGSYLFNGINVLVVEDEKMVRTIIQKMLEAMGVNVLTADNGSTAFGMLAEKRERIDLVLTDVIMPSMGGFELANKLSKLDLDIPVAFMSGYVDDSISGNPDESHDIIYLSKPFTKDELKNTLSQVFSTQ